MPRCNVEVSVCQKIRHGPYVDLREKSPPNCEKRTFDASEDTHCPFCKWSLEKWWPYVRAPLCGEGVDASCVPKRCHVECVEKAFRQSSSPDGQSLGIETDFASCLKRLFLRSPCLLKQKNPAVRVRLEEERMTEAGSTGIVPTWPWPAMPQLPESAFRVEGVTDFQITGCPVLCRVPSSIGNLGWVRTLCLMSNGLESIPSEIGSLSHLIHLYLNGNFLRTVPEKVGALPRLQEICLDANCLEELPPFSSKELVLFSAPANRLTALPKFANPLGRIEVHGNWLSSVQIQYPLLHGSWNGLVCLKVMGNQLTELPSELCSMPALRILSVSCNRLQSLPGGFSNMPTLEWFMAYENALSCLPADIAVGCPKLTRLLLEANPLQPSAVETLLANVRKSKIKTLGLDFEQISRAVSGSGASWEALPQCVSVGSIVKVPGDSKVSMKLTRASQLRRRPGLLAPGEPGGPAEPAAEPAKLLFVAFGASQGEPEWLGFCRRLYELGQVSPLPCEVDASVDEFLEGLNQEDYDCVMAKLWSGCQCGVAAQPQEKTDVRSCPIPDFDVLTVVDCRMRWYSEDISAVSAALEGVCKKYAHVICVGASMGGFGALLHGGRLAHSVLALSPQAYLLEACLRPPAESPAALARLSEDLRSSLCAAKERGSQITVHCAADEHFMHALAMPSDCISLVVHPICPRKPFARVLDKAELLLPIVADAIYNMLDNKQARGSEVSLGCWRNGGCLERRRAVRSQLLRLFFGPGTAAIPRTGDWFCGGCHARNSSQSFFCWRCKPENEKVGSPITTKGSVRVLDGTKYPSTWDWGCRNCGLALCGFQDSCTHCGTKWQPSAAAKA
eukprot:TRINITY_DN16597_c0_g1_i1.p1 TRINITY_DN16597_c0_g1~~TRINITY_DN16597_c0_g1_i1.p1  ORF type:complete len:846 (-),score=100.61 TRINITY_DN16597_c0_g1_i1:110-2647(-)